MRGFKVKIITFLVAIFVCTNSINVSASNNSNIISFVSGMYLDCLGRTPDPIGLNDWCSKLTRGEISGKELAYGFFYSPEFISKANTLTDSELVETYYRVFLNRSSDLEGKAYWLGQISNTNNDVSILFTGFADSVEFSNKCSSYGVNSGNHIRVPITNRSYKPTDDEYYSNLGYEIHYIDLGFGRTQKVYVRWYDSTNCMNQINSYRMANGVSQCNLVDMSNLDDPRVVWTRTRAIEVSYCFSHKSPRAYAENIYGGLAPEGYGGEDCYGAVVNGGLDGSAFNGWISSPMHNRNLLGDGVVGNSITMASCEIVLPDNANVDPNYPGSLSATVLNFWT